MVEECRNSGLSFRACCEEKNVNLKTYHYHLLRLRTMSMDQHNYIAPEIKKLPVVTPYVPVKSNVNLHLEGIIIEVQQGSDENTITTVLRAVKTAWLFANDKDFVGFSSYSAII